MRMVISLLLVTLAGLSAPALACDDHAPGTEPAAQRPAARAASLATGEVREVDLEDGTVTLKHGKIPALRMAPMSSMVFKTTDAASLANLKPGDKVAFRATMVGQQPTLTEIRLANR